MFEDHLGSDPGAGPRVCATRYIVQVVAQRDTAEEQGLLADELLETGPRTQAHTQVHIVLRLPPQL